MKKLIPLLAALMVVVPMIGAQASKSRTATGEYNTVVLDADDSGPIMAGHFSNGVAFKVKPGERFVTVVLEDKSGLPARATIGMDHDGNGWADDPQEFCGSLEKPYRVHPGMKVIVAAQEGQCPDGTNAVATLGTVTATFTR